jgi:hypothetical protein
MKVRQGFVSNSSTSSFIIAFKRKPKSPQEIKSILFDSNTIKKYSWPDTGEEYQTIGFAETIFMDIEKQKSASIDEISKELTNGWLTGAPDYHQYEIKGTDKIDWDAYEKASNIYATQVATEFVNENKDCEFFIVEYGDDNSYTGTMEHGGIFNKIPHIRLSKH